MELHAMEHQDNIRSFSRRRFMHSAGAGIVATGVHAAASAYGIELAPKDKEPPSIQVPGERPKKVGIAVVGLGELSLTQILPAFSSCALAYPAALVSGHPDKAKAVAGHYNVPAGNIYDYENFDRIKDNPDIKIVYIVLPNSMHAEFSIRAMKAGKDVLCEKPLAATVSEAEEMVEVSRSTGRKLMTAYRLRYEPFNQHMIQFAREKKYGAIRIITADNVQDVKAPNIRLSRKLGGGALGDVGVYCINACRYLTAEEPVEVFGQLLRPKDDPRFEEVEDRIIFQLRFPSGVLANCSAGFSSFVSRRYQVFCENGYFGLDPAFSYSGLQAYVGTKSGREQLQIEAANHFASEMDHFAACVVNDADPTTSGEDGLQDMRIISAIYESAEKGRVVKVGA